MIAKRMCWCPEGVGFGGRQVEQLHTSEPRTISQWQPWQPEPEDCWMVAVFADSMNNTSTETDLRCPKESAKTSRIFVLAVKLPSRRKKVRPVFDEHYE